MFLRTVLEYIDDRSKLAEFVERAKNSKVLAIDTEFLREKTYYPKLCLLQMATDDEVIIVDPFKTGGIRELLPILKDERVMKLFHAGSQDMEILLVETGDLPWPVFDTQIAAALLGQSHQVGLGSLVHSILGISLKKSDSFTDWSRRPLTSSQVKYAADDVIYLPKLYRIMVDELQEKNRLNWLDNDFKKLADPKRYEKDPRERYLHLKKGNQLSRRQLAAAREIAAWREVTAKKRNIPRKWVITDEQIVEACKRDSLTVNELFMVRGIKEHVSTADARQIISLVKKAYALPESEWPKLYVSPANEQNVDSSLDLMQALVRLRARENGIAMQTLASHSDLALVARGHIEDAEIMHGWRREVVGNELLDLLEGRLVLSLDNNELMVSRKS